MQKKLPKQIFDPQLSMLLNMAAESETITERHTAFQTDSMPNYSDANDKHVFISAPRPKTSHKIRELKIQAHPAKVLETDDPRRRDLKEAIDDEERGLDEKQAFRETKILKDARKDLSVLCLGYVFALKHVDTPQ